MRKLIIFIMFIFLIIPYSYSLVEPDLFERCKFDENSGVTTTCEGTNATYGFNGDPSWISVFPLTPANLTYYSPASLQFDGVDDSVNIEHGSSVSEVEGTYHIFVNTSTDNGDTVIIDVGTETFLKKRTAQCTDADTYCWSYFTGVNTFFGNVAEASVEDSEWHTFTFTWNCTSNTQKAYFDTVLIETDSTACTDMLIADDTSGFNVLGEEGGGSREWVGDIGAFVRFDKELTQNEIENLASCGNADDCNGTPAPVAVFIKSTPLDGVINNTQQTISINCSVENNNVSLFYDSQPDPINLVVDNQPAIFDFNTSNTTQTTYFYKASCNLGGTNSTVRSWTFDTTLPIITINPSNFFNESNLSSQVQYFNQVIANITLTDERDLFGFEINITRNDQVFFNFTNQTLTGNTNFDYTDPIDISNFPVGRYNISIMVSDSHTANRIKDYDVETRSRSIRFRTDEGNEILIKSNLGATTSTQRGNDRYRFDFDFGNTLVQEKKFTIKSTTPITFIEDSDFAGHFVIWNEKTKQGNWVDFEAGIGRPQVRAISTRNDIDFWGRVAYGYEVTFVTNENYLRFNSIGGLNIVTQDFSWYRGNTTLNNPVGTSGLPVTLSLNVTKDSSILDIGVSFVYNNTVQSLVSEEIRSEYVFFSKEITPPDVSVSSGDNISYFWNLTITQTSGSAYSFLVNANQTVLNNEVALCLAPTFIFPVFNVTYIDQTDDTTISVDNSFSLNFAHTKDQTFNGTRLNNESLSFCTNTDPTITELNVSISGEMTITKIDYATKLYDIPIALGFLGSNTDPLNLTVPLIRLNASSTIVFTWLTNTYDAIDGTMVVFECNGDGSRTLIDSIPIVDGTSSVNLELLNTVYSYEVITGGKLFTDQTSFSKCHIESQTERQFLVNVDEVDVSPTIGMYSIGCNITQIANNTVRMEWGSNPENLDSITACMFAFRHSAIATTQVYTNCTTTDHSFDRLIPNSGFDYSVSGKLFQSGFSIACDDIVEFKQQTEGSDLFGLNAVLAVFFLLSAFVLWFSQSARMQHFGMIIGLAISQIFGFLAFGWQTVMALIFFLIVIMTLGRYSKKQ